jgi:mono/diheme cytochrome c family protein
MTSWLTGPGRGVSLAGALLVLGGCASAPSAAPTVAPHEGDSRAPSETRVGEAGDDVPPAESGGAAEEGPHEQPSVTSPPSEQEAYERARPVFERHCASCHTSSAGKQAALRHFAMDRYPFGGHHAGQISGTIREVLGASGKPATMPKDRPGAVQAEELRAILDWADAFDRAHAAGNHHEHRHQH